ncbi:MAG TPA: DUF4350 domain-containing protein [Streptosporangiaceae bacterium]
MTAPATTRSPAEAGTAPGETARPDAAPAPQTGWRRWRAPIAIIAVIVAGGLIIALISQLSRPRPNTYLDPASSYFDGSHALTDILGERGFEVTRAYSPAAAIAAVRRAAGPAGQASPAGSAGRTPARSVTLVVTSPGLISRAHARALGRTGASLVLVAPGRRALAALAPAVTVAGDQAAGNPLHSLRPGCALPAARLAGPAQTDGFTYRLPPRGTGCYPAPGRPGYSVVTYTAAGRQAVTVLGSASLLTNWQLATGGNAALALNLLRAHRHIVWLVPQPVRPLPPPARPVQGLHRGPPLVPWEAELVVIQLAVAVVLAAVWRSRRLGPLIAERLPVVVRASETVEGHGRLYQARRARARAATILRSELLAVVLPAAGLPRDAPPPVVCETLAARTRFSPAEISALVFGPAPGTDDELVRLARSLDQLNTEVRAQ